MTSSSVVAIDSPNRYDASKKTLKLVSIRTAAKEEELNTKIDSKQLDEYLEKAFFYYDLPGLVVGIGDSKTGLTYTKAIGKRNIQTQESMQRDDIFHMASLAKLFTGTAVLILWEQGRIDLDMPVAGYLDQFQMADPRAAEITVRQLLTHTAGMPDVEDYHWDEPEIDADALTRYVCSDAVRNSRLLWDPGEKKFAYSNMGYEVLGLLVAKCSGISFEDFVQTEIFGPLGMDCSTFLTLERNCAQICAPHTKNAEKKIVLEKHYPYNRRHGPSSTLTSNIDDMAKWAMAHLNRSFLKEETYREAWKPSVLVPNNGEHVGLTWFIREQQGHQLLGHEGSDDGFRASFWICPELELFILVHANISDAPVKKISKEIFELMIT